MDESQQVVDLLERIPVPSSRVTAQEGLRLGRRGVRRRGRLTMGAAAVATVLVAVGVVNLAGRHGVPPPPGATATPTATRSPHGPQWTVSSLPNPGGHHYSAEGVDSTGRYIVGMADGRPVLWDNGKPYFLPAPEEKLVQVLVHGVNSSGVVIGTAVRQQGTDFAWVYRNGVSTRLPSPDSGRYNAADINDRGDILGWSPNSGPVIWPAAEPSKIKKLGSNVGAFCLGDDGSAGGTSGDGDHPYVWDAAGKATRLAELPGEPGGKVFFLGGDWAAGWVPAKTSSNLMGARWNLRTGELRSFPELAGVVRALSGNGAMVAGRRNLDQPVFVSPDGLITDLPRFGGETFYPDYATGMTFDGRTIVGTARSLAGSEGVIWRFG